MRSRQFLINVASITGMVHQRGQAPYTAVKFGVVGMNRATGLTAYYLECFV